MLQQKRILTRGNFYINHNFGEHLPAVDELCEMLHSNSYTSLIRKYSIMLKIFVEPILVVIRYRATQGHFAVYWNSNNITDLSCADLHWPEFYALLSDVNNDCNTYKNNVINNPYILDRFFTEKTESFFRHYSGC